MQTNRRNHPYVRPASPAKTEGLKKHSVKRPVLFVAGFVLVCTVLGWQQTDSKVHAELVPKTPEQTTRKVVKSSEAVPFPQIDTNSLTNIQKRLLAVAKAETRLGPTGYDKNVMKYTEGVKEDWCADFMSWLRDQAGIPMTNLETGYWRISGVLSVRDYYAKYNAYVSSDEGYTPKLGDLAFYHGVTPDGGSTDHIAMVLKVDGDRVYTIGGNKTEDSIVQIRANKLETGARGLVGFGKTAVN